ncbi:DUF4933 domain-containing protein [Parabacteroides sp. OttesenSCG-928-K15]|nr:DUF4933 domain-containing protein [Parabacteroides sp. OttesenSCG-928-K15]
MSTSFDLSEKWLLNYWTETDKHIYIGFSQNYDCPNTRKAGTIKFHQASLSKMNSVKRSATRSPACKTLTTKNLF